MNYNQDPNLPYIYNQYLILSGGKYPTHEEFTNYLQCYYINLYRAQQRTPVFVAPPQTPMIYYYPISPIASTPVTPQPLTTVNATSQDPLGEVDFDITNATSVSDTPISVNINSDNQENEKVVIDVKPEEYKQQLPKNFKYNKKYGNKNKDDCELGMSCKNIYCTFFHHPAADDEIFYKNK